MTIRTKAALSTTEKYRDDSKVKKVMSKNNILIRPAEVKDAHDINRLRRMPGIIENIMALPSETISNNERFIGNHTDDDHLFCAELNDEKGKRVVALA